MIKNLVFDFDGTIVDSGEIIYKDLVETLHIEAPSFQELRKYPAQKLMTSFDIKAANITKLLFKVRSEYKKYLPDLPLIEDMDDTLRTLSSRGARLFLCTSNSKENVNAFLKIHNLSGTFETIVGTMAVFGKSYGIKRTLKKFKLSPNETVYIGDETRDIQAARKAGIRSVSVSWGFNERSLLQEYKPDYLFDHAKELLQLIA